MEKANDLSLTLEKRKQYNQKAYQLLDLSKNDTVLRYYLYKVAASYRNMNDSKYFTVSQLHFRNATLAHDTLNLARYYFSKGMYHENAGISFDSALCNFAKAEKLYKKTNDIEGLAKTYLFKGLIQNNLDDYLGAEFAIKKGFNIIKNKESSRLHYRFLIMLGNIQHNLKNYSEAIQTHQKALQIATAIDMPIKNYKHNYRNTCMNNIGNSYKELKEYSIASEYFEKGIANKKHHKEDPLIFAYLYTNLGYCRMQQKDYRQLPGLFNQAIKIYDSLGVDNENAIAHVYLSEFYIRQNDTIRAILESENALSLAKKDNAPNYYLIALGHAGAINFKKASEYIQKYHQLNDSLQFEERKARSQFYKIQLETNEIVQQKQNAIQQKWIVLSVITGFLIIAILLFVVFRQHARQKLWRYFQNQQNTNQEVYALLLDQQIKIQKARNAEKKRIAMELHDSVMNRLASIRMNLFVLSKKKDQQTIDNSIIYVNGIENVEAEIQQICHNLENEIFIQQDDLRVLLEELIAEQNKHSKVKFTLKIEKRVNLDHLSGEMKMHIYRIIQELIGNTIKHAQASRASINFYNENQTLRIIFTDNGVGMSFHKKNSGIGLLNVSDRMKVLRGTFTISTTNPIGKGTKLIMTFPTNYV